jgi:hypothetical protein
LTKNITPSAANGPLKAGRRRDVVLFDGKLDAEMRIRDGVNDTRLRCKGWLRNRFYLAAQVSHSEMVVAAHYSACMKIHTKRSGVRNHTNQGENAMEQLTAAPTNRKLLLAVGCFSPRHSSPITIMIRLQW